MLNLLIIGGEGFVGSHVVKKFVRRGHRVAVFGPRMNADSLTDVKEQIVRIEGDILDYCPLFAAIHRIQPDVIIHLAAFGAGVDGLTQSAAAFPQRALQTNIMGFFNVLEAAKTLGVKRMIWASSSTVYAPASDYGKEPVNEDALRNPTTLYGSTKVMGELLTKQYQDQFPLGVTGVRLPLVFGPGKWYKGAGAAIDQMFVGSLEQNEVSIQGTVEPMDLMYVKDAADVFYQMAVHSERLRELYNVKGFTSSLEEIAGTIKTILPEYPLVFNGQSSSIVYPLMDTSRMEGDLSYPPKFNLIEACTDYLNEIRRSLP